MARASPIQGNFNAGEFSPLNYGRTDIERYKAGVARSFNMISTLQGASTARPGSKYVDEVETSANFTRVIPFKFSVTQAYMLEFGNNTIQFFANRARVMDGGSPYLISSPYSSADLPKLKYTQSLDTLYLFHPSYAPRKLERFGALDFRLTAIDFQNGPYLSGSVYSTATQILHPVITGSSSGTAGVSSTITVVGDTLSNCANNGAGLIRIQFTAISSGFDIAYLKSGDTVTISGVVGTTEANATWVVDKVAPGQYDLRGSAFVHAYVSGGTAAKHIFVSTDVGRLLKAKDPDSSTYGQGIITGYTNPRVVTITIRDSFGSTGAFDWFQLGLYSGTTGYPACGVFHEDRLMLGGPGGDPQRVDGSVVGDYENFATGTLASPPVITDSDAVAFSLNSSEVNAIRWMTSDERGLPIGTEGGPWILRPSILNEPITPTNVLARRVTSYGSADVQAVLAGKSTLFLSLGKRKIREFAFFYDVDGFRAVDLSEIAEHLTSAGVATELAFQTSPQQVLWTARSDGALLGMTYDRSVDALRAGWHQHQLGGSSDAAGTPPIVESLAVIPSPDGTSDDVWMVVKRWIDGATVRYVEYMTKMFERQDAQEDAFFVDCGLTYDSPKTVTAITAANPAVVSVTSHGFSTGDKVRFANVNGLKNSDGVDAINGKVFEITVIGSGSFSLDDFDSTDLTAFVAGGAEVRKLVSTISGLDHLEGETVQICGDGYVLDDKVVTSGVVALSSPAAVVHVGLGYSKELQQLRLEAGSSDGTSIGKNRRANEVAIMVDRSAAFEYGVNFDTMFPAAVREPSDNMDQAAPLYSGIIPQLQIESTYDLENRIAIRQSGPLPLTVVAIMPQMVTYDKG